MSLKVTQISNNSSVNSSLPPILLIHGWAMNNAVFQPLIEALPEYSFYGIDMPGHGTNAAVDLGSSLDDWAAAAEKAILTNVDLSSFHLVAWSLGGMLATRLANTFGHKCVSLSLLCSNPRFVQAEDWQYAMPEQYLSQFIKNLQENKQQVMEDFMALQVRGSQQAESVLAKVMALVEEGGLASEQGLNNGLHILKHDDERQTLSELACPVNVVLGKNDTLVPRGVKADFEKLVPNATINTVLKAGHAPFISHVEETAGIMQDFLKQVAGGN